MLNPSFILRSLLAPVLLAALLLSPRQASEPASAGAQGQGSAAVQVEEALLEAFAENGTSGYLIFFSQRPDLSAAYDMEWTERGRYVYEELTRAAEQSQQPVREYLDRQGMAYQSFWIDNVIAVESSDRAVFSGLLSQPGIREITTRKTMTLIEPVEAAEEAGTESLLAVEANLLQIQADQAWALGITGSGVVVANIDTGVRYTHHALVSQYRGYLGGGFFDHHFDWWDPYQEFPTEPADLNGHGTHTMGAIVGSDGDTNQTGAAPGAKWIACRGCNSSTCSDASLYACAEFVSAPWNLNGAGANPDLRAHVVNNSWGDCSRSYENFFQAAVDSWQAFGVYPLFANGNALSCSYALPPGLNTVSNPARYGNVTGVGSSTKNTGEYAVHSNWGPGDEVDAINPRSGSNGVLYSRIKPQVVSPGVNIRSAYHTSDNAYQMMTGTSMSTPQVAGLAALMLQAAPGFKGNYALLESLLEETATPIPYPSGGFPVPPWWNVPNYAAGWGEVNALRAVAAAACQPGSGTTLSLPCLAASPRAYTLNVAAGTTLTTPLYLQNTGKTAAAFSISPLQDWLTITPASGSLAPNSSMQVQLTFSASGLVNGNVREAVLLLSSNPALFRADIPVRMTVVNPVAGISLPTSMEGSGPEGETVLHLVSVANTGTVADTYQISVSGGTWISQTIPTAISLNPGATALAGVKVHIPADTPLGETDVLTFTAVSTYDPSTQASTPITTRVRERIADLSVQVKVVPEVLLQGALGRLSVGVHNAGPDRALEVRLDGDLPAGLNFVSFISGEGCTHAAGKISCTIGEVEFASGRVIDIEVSSQQKNIYYGSMEVSGWVDQIDSKANNRVWYMVPVGRYQNYAPLMVRGAR
jgi:subtilisin family serine protease